MKHLKSSGDMGCPCSVPQRTSIFSESLFKSLIFALEFVYMKSMQPKNLPLMPSFQSLYKSASRQTVSNALGFILCLLFLFPLTIFLSGLFLRPFVGRITMSQRSVWVTKVTIVLQAEYLEKRRRAFTNSLAQNFTCLWFLWFCSRTKRFYINHNPNLNPNHNPEAIPNPNHNPNPSPKQSNLCFISLSLVTWPKQFFARNSPERAKSLYSRPSRFF